MYQFEMALPVVRKNDEFVAKELAVADCQTVS
jgi:hypothetical protein